MTRFQRVVVSGVIGFVAGILGFRLVAIFFPLIVPLTLEDPHHNDTLLVLVGFGVYSRPFSSRVFRVLEVYAAVCS